jgi:hypothetical protein
MSNKIQQNILNQNNRLWIDNIESLVSSFQIFPKKENSKEENFNNISRLLFLVFLVFFFIQSKKDVKKKRHIEVIILFIISMFILTVFYFRSTKKEYFKELNNLSSINNNNYNLYNLREMDTAPVYKYPLLQTSKSMEKLSPTPIIYPRSHDSDIWSFPSYKHSATNNNRMGYVLTDEYEELNYIDEFDPRVNTYRDDFGLLNLNQYCNKVPVLGFNSGKYDINLNIKEFMNEIHKRGNIDFVIKNGNTFKALMANNFIFLDICQYLPAGFNLDKYLNAFNPNGEQKSIFPYEFLGSYEKLDYSIDELSKDDFHSSLKNSDISEKEWESFLENKTKFQWKTVRDLLEYYNNLDVKPFLQSIIKQREFFYDLGIDMFKDGFSLPALAEKIMFSYEFKDFNENFIHQKIPITEKYPKFESNWKEKKRNYIILFSF